MRIVKLIVISAIVFFGLACVVAFFIPSRIRVFRMTAIGPNKVVVLDHVRDISKWKNWYPNFENVELSNVRAVDGKVVAATANGINLKIVESADSVVVVRMQRGDRPVINGWQINKDIRNDSLALQAYMDFDLKWYPWEKFSSLLLDKSYGDRLAEALNNLKKTANQVD